MALWLSVGAESLMKKKREMLMNRNCRKVLLHRGGHRVNRVAQRIHRVMTRGQCRCFERNGISGFRFVWSLPRPLRRHRSRTTDQVRFSYKFERISSRNVPPYGGQIRFAKPTTRKQTPREIADV